MRENAEREHGHDATHRRADRTRERRRGERRGAEVTRDGDEVGDRGHDRPNVMRGHALRHSPQRVAGRRQGMRATTRMLSPCWIAGCACVSTRAVVPNGVTRTTCAVAICTSGMVGPPSAFCSSRGRKIVISSPTLMPSLRRQVEQHEAVERGEHGGGVDLRARATCGSRPAGTGTGLPRDARAGGVEREHLGCPRSADRTCSTDLDDRGLIVPRRADDRQQRDRDHDRADVVVGRTELVGDELVTHGRGAAATAGP